MEKRTCKKCGEEKIMTSFTKSKICKNGYAHTCRKCMTEHVTAWKRKHSVRLAERRRQIYAATEGLEVKKREMARKALHPLRVKCQMLRGGMRERSRLLGLQFDSHIFTVEYLMNRIEKNPMCECCKEPLNLSSGLFGKRQYPNPKSPSIDKVDCSKGYTLDNVAILCWGCNRLKSDASKEQMLCITKFMHSWGNRSSCDVSL